MVVSLAPGERLELAAMQAIEERMAETLGLGEHQRIAGIHRNTDCWHMHIAINKVHPESLRTVTPYRGWPKLRALCRELEQAHGLTQTSLSREAERYLSDRAARMEIHEGRESFTRWARAHAGAALLAARDSGGGWQAVHAAAARLGMEIKPRGAGLVVSPSGVTGYGIKASALDRGLGIKAMTDRLGAYAPPQPGQALPEAETRYTSAPAAEERSGQGAGGGVRDGAGAGGCGAGAGVQGDAGRAGRLPDAGGGLGGGRAGAHPARTVLGLRPGQYRQAEGDQHAAPAVARRGQGGTALGGRGDPRTA